MLKVVVVDDEKLVRKGIVLEVDWTALDCMVVAEAENGEQGLETVLKYEPDLIITDIRMPRMDGIEMISKLRNEGCRANVIFLTAYSDFTYAQSAIKLYAADYLLKPFEDGELEAAVRKISDRVQERLKKAHTEKVEDLFQVKKGDKSKYIMEALDYISEHCGEELGVGVISETLGISEGHLSHLFKKETEYTVMAYITQFRMQKAMKLLSDCRHKVYEVAEMVGYKDITYFSSTFKRIVGVTPSDYQDRCQRK